MWKTGIEQKTFKSGGRVVRDTAFNGGRGKKIW
jgi:hypothetical protein